MAAALNTKGYGKFWFKWQQLNTNGYGKFNGSEIVAVYQHKFPWKWLDTSKLASRAIITLSKQQPGLNVSRTKNCNIYILILRYIATRSGSRYLQVSLQDPPAYVPDYSDISNSANRASLSLEGLGIFSMSVNVIRPSNGWKVSVTL